MKWVFKPYFNRKIYGHLGKGKDDVHLFNNRVLNNSFFTEHGNNTCFLQKKKKNLVKI